MYSVVGSYVLCMEEAGRLSLGSIFEGGSVKEKEIRTCTWEYEVTKQYLALSASIFWYDFAQGDMSIGIDHRKGSRYKVDSAQ